MLIHSCSIYGKPMPKDKEFLPCHQRMLKNPKLTLMPKVKIKYRSSLYATPILVMIHQWSKYGKLTENNWKFWPGKIKCWKNTSFLLIIQRKGLVSISRVWNTNFHLKIHLWSKNVKIVSQNRMTWGMLLLICGFQRKYYLFYSFTSLFECQTRRMKK